MNKRIKRISIILNIIATLGFLISILITNEAFRLEAAEDLSSLGLLILLPAFLFFTVIILIFAIILLVMFKKAKKTALAKKSKLKFFDFLYFILPTLYLIANIISAIIFIIND